MPLKDLCTMKFISSQIKDDGVELNFVAADPGPGEPSDYIIFLTDAEVASIATPEEAVQLANDKLKRKYRGVGITLIEDALRGQAFVI